MPLPIQSPRLHDAGHAGVRFARSHIVPLGVLSLLPFLLVVFHDFWGYTSTQSAMIDPWLYTSYFLHLKTQLAAFPDAYYGDRLSAVLPGWLLYQVFGSWLGNHIHKLVVIYAALFAIYYCIRTLFS